MYQPIAIIIKKINSGTSYKPTSTLYERSLLVIRMVFLQEKLLQDKLYGFMHFWFLYGFIVLSIGHLELIITGCTKFLENYNYSALTYAGMSMISTSLLYGYNLSQDIFAFFVTLVSIYALYRRLTLKEKRLIPRSKDAEIILWFILSLYISFFAFTALELSLTEYTLYQTSYCWFWFYPFSSLLSVLLANVLNLNTLIWLTTAFYFIHLCIFLCFACYVPRSKHMHLIFAGPNIFLSNVNVGSIQPPRNINFETDETYGINNVRLFSWKDLLNSFACTECGRCNDVCPAHMTDKPLKPKKIINDIKHNLMSNSESIIKTSDSTGSIDIEELWACTTCGACAEVCPVLIDSVPSSIIEMRRHLVLTEASHYPKELNVAFKSMENQSNPWGIGQDKRIDWCKDLDINILAHDKSPSIKYLLFVGCASSTDEKAIKSLKKFIIILKLAKIEFAILGTNESCCGDPARRMGNEYLYEMLVEKNINQFKKFDVKNILTTCPHCYNQLRNEYQKFNVQYNVFHHSEFILSLIKSNKIHIKADNNILKKDITTFHDPCYLGRYNKDFTSGRDILKKMSVNVTEMSLNKERSFCCGAGGGKMFMEENIGSRINATRIQQAKKVHAHNIITSCPFCKTMLADAISDDMVIKDIVDVTADYIK